MRLIRNICFLLISLFLIYTGCTRKKPTDGGGGSEPSILPAYFDHPAWHPEGKWIAAEHCGSADTDGDDKVDQWSCGIWLVNSENGETQPLIEGFSFQLGVRMERSSQC